MGSPVPHVYIAMLQAMLKQDIGGTNKKDITDMLQTASAMASPNDLLETVRVAQAKSTYDKASIKVTLVMLDKVARKSVLSAVTQMGWEHKSSAPPPSPQEDELEKWLQSLQIEK